MGWQRTLNVEVMDASPRSSLLPSSTSYHFLARPTPCWFLGWTLVSQGNLAPRSPQMEYSLQSLAFGYPYGLGPIWWTMSPNCLLGMFSYDKSLLLGFLPATIYIYSKKKKEKNFHHRNYFFRKNHVLESDFFFLKFKLGMVWYFDWHVNWQELVYINRSEF